MGNTVALFQNLVGQFSLRTNGMDLEKIDLYIKLVPLRFFHSRANIADKNSHADLLEM